MHLARRSRHRARHYLLAFSLLMVVVALGLFSQIQRLSTGMYDMFTLELLNGAANLPLELRALEVGLWRAAGNGNVDAARLAYDIVWNRLDTLAKGEVLHAKIQAIGPTGIFEAIHSRFIALDPTVAGLAASDRTGIKAAAEVVAEIRGMAIVLNRRTHQVALGIVAEKRRSVERLYWAFGLTILLTAVSVALLTWVLIRTISELDRGNSELAAMSRDLDAALQQSQSANHTKTEFLAVMSHELRTPLNAVIGFAEFMAMLGDKITDERRNEYLQSIVTSGRHLLGLVNQVLHFAKVDSDTTALADDEFDVAAALREAAELAAASGGDGVGRIVIDGTPPAARLRADTQAVRQMLLNLLVNAHKFSPPDRETRVHVLRASDGALGLQVADQGRGMSEAEIRVALQPFGQIAGAHARAHGGVGLGLPITVRLVEQHGGRLQIESAQGQGCRVTLWFPAGRVAWADDSREAA